MNRTRHRLLHGVTALAALLTVVVTSLWIRSYRHGDTIAYIQPDPSGGENRGWKVWSADGRLQWVWGFPAGESWGPIRVNHWNIQHAPPSHVAFDMRFSEMLDARRGYWGHLSYATPAAFVGAFCAAALFFEWRSYRRSEERRVGKEC